MTEILNTHTHNLLPPGILASSTGSSENIYPFIQLCIETLPQGLNPTCRWTGGGPWPQRVYRLFSILQLINVKSFKNYPRVFSNPVSTWHSCGHSFATSLEPFPEKAMTAHSSTLAWKIPWMEEPGGLPSLGSHRVGHDWSDLAAAIDMQIKCRLL